MATVTPTAPVAAGSALTTTACSGTGVGADQYANSGKEVLVVTNGGGASITVTRIAQATCSQGVLHNDVVTVPAGQTRYLKPVNPSIFCDDNGMTKLTASASASVTYAVVVPT